MHDTANLVKLPEGGFFDYLGTSEGSILIAGRSEGFCAFT